MKNNIKNAREARGFTQQECADTFGVKIRAWQTYEQGVSEPKYELLCKIADTFGVATDYLLGRRSSDVGAYERFLQLVEEILVDAHEVPQYASDPAHQGAFGL